MTDSNESGAAQLFEVIDVPPAIESLLHIARESSFWPVEIRENPFIRVDARQRLDLFAKLDALFKQLPLVTAELTEAIDSGNVDPEFAAELYAMLADFLDSDSYNRRLVLYFPFELVPRKNWQSRSSRVAGAAEHFRASYMKCWRELLVEKDVRANFVDGDILETELSPSGQPVVCKAAHLIPYLVEKELLATADAVALLDTNPSEALRRGVVDVLPVLAGMSYLDYGECDRITRAHGFYPYAEKRNASICAQTKTDRAWLAGLAADAEFEMKKIEMRVTLDESRDLPRPRVAWERLDREDKLASRYADRMAMLLAGNPERVSDIRALLASADGKVLRLAIIRGLGRAVELLVTAGSSRAVEMAGSFQADLRDAWVKGVPGERDAITSVLIRWVNQGILQSSFLEWFGIEVPCLDKLHLNGNRLIAAELEKLAPVIEAVRMDDELSRLLYPIVIFFGSRLKGYAKRNADVDIAVFVKADVLFADRPRIRQALSRVFPDNKIRGSIVEFWLAAEGAKGDKLVVRDLADMDVSLADSTWAHVLLGGVWFGSQEAIKELYANLLPGFLYSNGKKFESHDARTEWLKGIEREVLQYRLMHKGYRRLYPEQGGIKAPNAHGIDPQSVFWDSGYRRLATTLFVSRVFLPQIVSKSD
ncbi:MAG: hypothetical protein A2939_04820 [Parcubacteria group bacterium RIFCSPLOWO2_01_FULL_48_18]|nr:MAG: hypothetical protein A2939_04820 [Parcubacteria group bacterium RIFCSPLOWO2_01_FULL_48_18]OHB24046.1 MAG: hypothetical protein A3J67_04560 [Parcubacteria group bacterium RIFCSPHIGHO2_02_FULL_48_10b]